MLRIKPKSINNILNPLLSESKIESYKGQTLSEDSSVLIGGGVSDSGVIQLQIKSLKASIPSGVNSAVAPLKKDGKVVNYIITTSGFDNVERKGNYMLYDSREMWMGTNPVLIYKMVVKAKLKDLVDTKNYLSGEFANHIQTFIDKFDDMRIRFFGIVLGGILNV